jgi:hypothetical protein
MIDREMAALFFVALGQGNFTAADTVLSENPFFTRDHARVTIRLGASNLSLWILSAPLLVWSENTTPWLSS